MSLKTGRIARWILALLAPLLLVSGVKLADKLVAPPEEWRIEQVDAVMLDQLTPPADEDAWRSHVLPVPLQSINQENSFWYRLSLAELELPIQQGLATYGDEPWLLSVGAPYGSVALYRNDQLAEEIGQRVDPLSVYRWPVAFSLSPEAIQSGDTLYVNFTRSHSTGWLYFNYLAPTSLLEPYVDYQYFLRVVVPRLIQLVMVTVGVIMLLLLWQRPSDGEYGWWSFLLFFWALREATGTSVDPWLDNPHYGIVLRNLSLGGFALCGYLFIKRYIGVSHSIFDPAIWVSGAIWVGLLLYFAHTELLTPELSTLFWTPWVVVVALLCCILLARSIGRSAGEDTGWLLAVCWCVTVVGIYDYRVPIDPYAIAGYVQYLQYCAGPALIVFTAILMRRFAQALNTAERANAHLEERVALQTEELSRSYARAHAAEKQQLVNEERERIMRDMHDGIGGQLVQALSMVSQDKNLTPIEATLREALDDLRLIIDSLSVPEGNLSVLLATLRHRLTQPIERAGLQFDWQLQDIPDCKHLSQSDLLHVLRILQESVTNILKHASATRLGIATDLDSEGRVRVRVTDDGRGLGKPSDQSIGRGLPGMRKRAAAIGAQVHVVDRQDHRGALVELILPKATLESQDSD